MTNVTEQETLARRPHGPATVFRPKDPPNVSLNFASCTKTLLGQAHRRTRQSRSTIVEYLIRQYADTLQEGLSYGPKTRPHTCVSLTALAKHALANAAERLGWSRSDVAEELIMQHAAALSRRDFQEAK